MERRGAPGASKTCKKQAMRPEWGLSAHFFCGSGRSSDYYVTKRLKRAILVYTYIIAQEGISMQTERTHSKRGTLDILAGLRVQREAGKRLAILAVLCLLLPPVGLICLWRSRHTNMPVRLGLSLASVLMMVLVMSLVRPHAGVEGVVPTPVRAERVGYLAAVPEATAQPQDYNVTYYSTDTTEGTDVSLETAYVYAADGIDSYYHATADAENMVNLRQLTYAQALREGLTPCPNCYPASAPAEGE